MGLDQFIIGKTRIGMNPETWNQREDIFSEETRKLYPHVKEKRVKSVEEELIYFRKFNALHGWFVKKCLHPENVDDSEIWFDFYLIKELISDLKEVLEELNSAVMKEEEVQAGWSKETGTITRQVRIYVDTPKALELLPPTDGFFFGSTYIDEYYKNDVEYALKAFQEILEEEGADEKSYYYIASY